MSKNNTHIYIISEDIIFINLFEKMFFHFFKNTKIERISSVTELKEKELHSHPDLIILDDLITGSTSIEVISYLRLRKKVLSTICFFSVDVPEIEIKVLERGANYFYKKPFNPRNVIKEILTNMNLLVKEQSIS